MTIFDMTISIVSEDKYSGRKVMNNLTIREILHKPTAFDVVPMRDVMCRAIIDLDERLKKLESQGPVDHD